MEGQGLFRGRSRLIAGDGKDAWEVQDWGARALLGSGSEGAVLAVHLNKPGNIRHPILVIGYRVVSS